MGRYPDKYIVAASDGVSCSKVLDKFYTMSDIKNMLKSGELPKYVNIYKVQAVAYTDIVWKGKHKGNRIIRKFYKPK